MKVASLLLFCAAAWLFQASAFARSVGFSRILVPDGTDPPLEVGIWYPTAAVPRPTRIGLFTQQVAPEAPVEGAPVEGAPVEGAPVGGSRLPLVVILHGQSGDFVGHGDTALALAGFVAAALTHTGDNYRDQSRALDMAARPRQLHVLVDAMIGHWAGGVVDASRVGAFGFSSGGFTVLTLAGGNPRLSLVGPHCEAHPDFFDCRLIAAHRQAGTPAVAAPAHFTHDVRIRAIVVAAPALGFTFMPHGLDGVTIPVQLWRAGDDDILPSPLYAEAVAAALPRPPEMHVVPHARHYDFLAPCPDALARIAPAICTSEAGFDRAAFHRSFDTEVVAFFTHALAPEPGGAAHP